MVNIFLPLHFSSSAVFRYDAICENSKHGLSCIATCHSLNSCHSFQSSLEITYSDGQFLSLLGIHKSSLAPQISAGRCRLWSSFHPRHFSKLPRTPAFTFQSSPVELPVLSSSSLLSRNSKGIFSSLLRHSSDHKHTP